MKIYIVYDGRFVFDEERASVLFTTESLKEAKKLAPDYGDNNVIVEYEDKKGSDQLEETNRWYL